MKQKNREDGSCDPSSLYKDLKDLTMIIKLENLGEKHFQRDIVLDSHGDHGIASISIDGTEVGLYPKELDNLIASLQLIRDHNNKLSSD